MSRVLIDFDGVMFKNKNVHDIIKKKSIEYVSKSLNVSLSKAKKINEYHYKKYGHSTIHLPCNTSLKDYNAYVFDSLNWNAIKDVFTDEDVNRMKLYESLSDKLKTNHDIQHYLFSNAPLDYCENVTDLLGINLYNIVDANTFTSDLLTNKSGIDVLKPLPISYEYVSKIVKGNKLHFIDDSIINIEPLKYDNKWLTYHMDTNEDKQEIDQINEIYSNIYTNIY